jgi:phosphotransferase system enzyme I (PtsI)
VSETVRIGGIPASPGIAIATARVIDRGTLKIPKRCILDHAIDDEVMRLHEAIDESKKQILEAKEAVTETVYTPGGNHALIFEGHLLMLEDEFLVDGAIKLIREERDNAEWAISKRLEAFKAALSGLGNEFLRERIDDVMFVGHRIIRNLMGFVTDIVDMRGDPCILVSESLSPAETTQMVGSPVLGFATDTGTRTSHTAIMAQALGIPAVVGVESLGDHVNAKDTIIVDGNDGVVIIRPDVDTIREYKERAARYAELEKKLLSARDEPAMTTDGQKVTLLCNVEFPAEAAMALDYGAEGIGLYRTEFLYMNRSDPPSEDEQYASYRAALIAMQPRPVVFRTFDLGADKLPMSGPKNETNPAMGLRAIRLGLKNPEMFKTHLRALLRAANHGELQIMFPMISGVDELRKVKSVLNEAKETLGDDAPEHVRVGCMIELPSAVFAADLLAREVDFFSIGTNDLIQYSLAIDRVNDHVAYLYSPFHPGILRAIFQVMKAARRVGIPVSMCGNMAAESRLIPLLIGFGLRSLSMAPTLIPSVKAMIRTISSIEALKIAQMALEMNTAKDVEYMVNTLVAERLNMNAPR